MKKVAGLLLTGWFFVFSGKSTDIQRDRWIVMDFAWFNPATMASQADTLFDRYMPLWKNVSGRKGIIFSFNWTVDLVTEYTGNINQQLPFTSPLSRQWNERRYLDIKELVGALKQEAHERNLDSFYVGMECVAWPSLVMAQGKYNYRSRWAERHPEMYKKYGVADPLCRLEKDKYAYASFPKGLPGRVSFGEFFGKQWAAVSRDLGLNLMLFWDSWATLRCYNRVGVFGEKASADPRENKAISDAIIRFFSEVKKANPQALLFGYSSGASAVGEYRINTFDLEGLVADGSIDAWIDQTWGGAWNDFWGMERLGWTFQMAYVQQHAQMIARANTRRQLPCRHYTIAGVLDAYEPWDVIHTVPQKLRWSLWAYSHAGALTPDGYKCPDGTLIAWANSSSLALLSSSDVQWLAQTLDEADQSASRISFVGGAVAVYNRSMMEWLNEKDPASLNDEWIDEQVGMLMKWGLPCMASTRLEWLTQLPAGKRMWLYQLPGHCNDETVHYMMGLLKTKCPQMITGRADRISPEILRLGGWEASDSVYPAADYPCVMEGKEETGLLKNSVVRLSCYVPLKSLYETVVYVAVPQGPLLAQLPEKNFFYWHPPDWRHPEQATLDQHQYGSIVPYYVAVRELQRSCKQTGLTHVRPLQVMNPVTFHYWKSGSRYYFLFGNLETNAMGDSRTRRDVFLYISREELQLSKDNYELKDYYGNRHSLAFGVDQTFLIYFLKIDPEGMGLYFLEP